MNKKSKAPKDTLLPSLLEFKNIVATFILVMLTNIVFRADSVAHVGDYFSRLFSMSFFSYPLFTNRISALISLIFSVVFLVVEWLQRDKEHGLQLNNAKIPQAFRWLIYYIIGIVILWFGGTQDTFIYFQF